MSLREDAADIESHEFHQANLTHGVLYDLPHFRIRRRGSNILGEVPHIGPADCSFDRGDDIFEWLLRNDAPALDVDRADFHTFISRLFKQGTMFFSAPRQSKPGSGRASRRPRGGWNDGTSSQFSL